MIRCQTPAVRRISAARSDPQSRQQRGQRTAQETGQCPAKKGGRIGHISADGSKSLLEMRPRFRSAEIDNCVSNRQSLRESPTPAAIRDPHAASMSYLRKDRAARIPKHSNRPVFQEATLPDELAASPPGWC